MTNFTIKRFAAVRAKLPRMQFFQTEIRLKPRPRGFHLVTREIVAALPISRGRVGFAPAVSAAHVGIADHQRECRSRRARRSRALVHHAVPENAPYFEHTAEGPDDMPAHVKSSVIGCSVTIPIRDGRLALGTWQGIYLGEHRADASGRTIVATIWGE